MNDNIIKYCKLNPGLEIQDVFKFLYQSCFGCEHLACDFEYALKRINTEKVEADMDKLPAVEMLEGDFCRIHLSIFESGLSPHTLCKLFLMSAEPQANGLSLLEERLQELTELSDKGLLPFSDAEIKEAIYNWKKDDYPPCHHSESFSNFYHPAYRVVKKTYVKILPILIEIDKMLNNSGMIVAIDGRCASGKTTLASLLGKIYDCNLFHMDDFFLTPEQRTRERLAVPGENVDHERFKREVLIPLKEGLPVEYKRYDCCTKAQEAPVIITPKRLNIIEGVYSMHPELIGFYDFKLFMDISTELQRERISTRNSPELAQRFFNEWIPLEELYFDELSVRRKADLILGNQ